MERDEILRRVQLVTATMLNIDEGKCAEDKNFTADLGADSI